MAFRAARKLVSLVDRISRERLASAKPAPAFGTQTKEAAGVPLGPPPPIPPSGPPAKPRDWGKPLQDAMPPPTSNFNPKQLLDKVSGILSKTPPPPTAEERLVGTGLGMIRKTEAVAQRVGFEQQKEALAHKPVGSWTEQEFKLSGARSPAEYGQFLAEPSTPRALLGLATKSMVPEKAREWIGEVPVIGPTGERLAEYMNPLIAAGFAIPGAQLPLATSLVASATARSVAEGRVPEKWELPIELAAGVAGFGAPGLARGLGRALARRPAALIGEARVAIAGPKAGPTAELVRRRVTAGEDLAPFGTVDLHAATGVLAPGSKELQAVVRELARRGQVMAAAEAAGLPDVGALLVTQGAKFVIGTRAGEPLTGRLVSVKGRRITLQTSDGEVITVRRGAASLAPTEEAANEFSRRALAGENIAHLVWDLETPAAKISRLLRQIKGMGPQTTLELHAARSAAAGRMAGISEAALASELAVGEAAQALARMGAARAGAQKTPLGFMRELAPSDLDQMKRMILREATLTMYEKPTASAVLDRLLLTGEKIPKADRELLGRVFGDEFVKISAFRARAGNVGSQLIDVANIPRTVMASYDLSATLRQGGLLSVAHPISAMRAMAAQLKAVFSEQGALAVDEAIRATPNYAIKKKAGLYLAPIEGGTLTTAEEFFMSQLVKDIPILGKGIRISERAYITYLNKLRSDVFDSLYESWGKAPRWKIPGPEFLVGGGARGTTENYQGLADFINKASGRGTLGPLDKAAPLLNAAFFAPRFLVSRPETVAMMFHKSPTVRMLAIQDVVKFFSTGVSILALLKYSGLAQVELDPRSTDFGRIRIGDTRLDFWAGFQTWPRYLAQIALGERKAGSGMAYDISRWETIGRLGWSKTNPAFGLIVDIFAGQTFIGDEMRLSPGSVRAQAWNRLTPMVLQEIVSGFQQAGFGGLLLSLPTAVLGIGAMTYRTPFDEVYDKTDEILAEMGRTREDYDSDLALRTAVKQRPELKELIRKLDEDAKAHGETVQGRYFRYARELRDVTQAQYEDDEWKVKNGFMFPSEYRAKWEDSQTELFWSMQGARDIAGVEFETECGGSDVVCQGVEDWFGVGKSNREEGISGLEEYTDPVTGQVDFGQLSKDREAAIAWYPEETRLKILGVIRQHDTEFQTELRQLEVILDEEGGYHGYREWFWEDIAGKNATPIRELLRDTRVELVENLERQDITPAEVHDQLKATNTFYAEYDRRLQKELYNYRFTNPDQEAAAYLAGDITKILSPTAAQMVVDWWLRIYPEGGERWPDDFEQIPTGYKGRAYQRPPETVTVK